MDQRTDPHCLPSSVQCGQTGGGSAVNEGASWIHGTGRPQPPPQSLPSLSSERTDGKGTTYAGGENTEKAKAVEEDKKTEEVNPMVKLLENHRQIAPTPTGSLLLLDLTRCATENPWMKPQSVLDSPSSLCCPTTLKKKKKATVIIIITLLFTEWTLHPHFLSIDFQGIDASRTSPGVSALDRECRIQTQRGHVAHCNEPEGRNRGFEDGGSREVHVLSQSMTVSARQQRGGGSDGQGGGGRGQGSGNRQPGMILLAPHQVLVLMQHSQRASFRVCPKTGGGIRDGGGRRKRWQ